MPSEIIIYYDAKTAGAIEAAKANYVYHETGLTPFNCYSQSDAELCAAVEAEIFPEELVRFLHNLYKTAKNH